ncbi:MAG: DUF1549 domain-containing protein [Candidatus Saccharimonas sp.]|nr:DUF1549 domain-containing protein [Planctomycetaceae bacterium]
MRFLCMLCCGVSWLVSLSSNGAAIADEPLHARIDQLIEATVGTSVAPVSDDAEFLRRAFLDFAGRVPSVEEARTFLSDPTAEKRVVLIDRLLASAEFPRRMREAFHVQLMERAGEHEEWSRFLEQSFAANKPWDQLVREILNPNADDEATRGAAYFLTKRLENYGQQPVDLPGLTRDVGRLFLGVDLQCAQCHDHLFIDDYKQVDFQGLHTFVSHTTIRQDVKFPAVTEKLVAKKTEFMSVFVKEAKVTGPRLPFGTEVDVPTFAKGEEFAVAPDTKTKTPGKPKFSPLAILAEQLPTASNTQFARNIVNRLWWQMLGRGLVHPLDLHHSKNPASHPAVLELLASEFVVHQFDIKWLLRELALTRTYQRGSLLPSGLEREPLPDRYVVAIEKPLSTEQLLWSILQATGELRRYQPTAESDGKLKPNAPLEDLKKRFVAAFANPPREPEGDFAPSVKAALFLSNDGKVLELLKPRDGNLAERLVQESDSAKLADLLYVAILSRTPSPDEAADVAKHLASHADDRAKTTGQLLWALIASTEFCVNH